MQEPKVKITLLDSQDHKQDFEFEEHQLCVVGRSHDCDISAPESVDSMTVSRHHCLLDIDPPMVRIYDLGSTNGTYVNGLKIPRHRASRKQLSGIRLHKGDVVRVGHVRLCIDVPGESSQNHSLEIDHLESFNEGDGSEERTLIGGKQARS